MIAPRLCTETLYFRTAASGFCKHIDVNTENASSGTQFPASKNG